MVFWTDVEPRPEAVTLLRQHGDLCGPRFPRADGLEASIADADAAFVGASFDGSSGALERAHRLKVVARFGGGFDNIDLRAATQLGICVICTPSAPTLSVSEYTIGLIIALYRSIPRSDRAMREGLWAAKARTAGNDLSGKHLGVVGLGRIGSRVITLAQAFHMKTAAYDPYVDEGHFAALGVARMDSLEGLLRWADVVTLHLPSSDATSRLIGPEQLAAMKATAFLVNVSRGSLVDQEALGNALRGGALQGAALDVFDREPPDPEDPLLRLDNVIVTPHMAANTVEGRRRSNVGAVRQALQALCGERPPGLVNGEVWEHRRR